MSLKDRLKKLETKHTEPMKIFVCIVDGDRFYPGGEGYPGGPGLSEAEYDALYPTDENTRTIEVDYVDMAEVNNV